MKANSDTRDFIRYPTNRVVGTIGHADKAHAALDALLRAGFEREDIDVLHGEEALQRLDLTGANHGLFAQVQRTLIRAFELEEFKHLTHQVEDLRAGRFVIMVLARRRGLRIIAADILHEHGAEFVGFYGRWAYEDLPAHPPMSPEDVPALFARAWNDRDPAALASLFDEDAEFVNATGLWSHDRESIRRTHASRLADAVDHAMLAMGEIKVKRLSAEVAVVHARMTLSGAPVAEAVAPAAPRTTIVSFVVHRAGDRWLCASSHSTDVPAAPGTTSIDQARAFGVTS